jgi:hypothetical protein
MIFGWLEGGKTDRWVLVDPLFPWPALHHGRNALRGWADAQNKARATAHTAGPRRMPHPCKTAVKEDGSAVLNVWPCEPYGQPRAWGEHDGVWKAAIADLAAAIANAIGCPVTVAWMGAGDIERQTTTPHLKGMGFIGWGKGEKAPRGESRDPPKDLKISVKTADLRILPQGDAAWH